MVLKILLILNCLACSSAACTEGEANCPANYEGEESGLAQIKAHKGKKTSLCPEAMTYNQAEIAGVDIDKDHGGWQTVTPNNWRECKQKCRENQACRAWTMKYGNADNGGVNCYLKSQHNQLPGALSKDTGLASGVMHSACSAHPSGSHMVDSCEVPDCPDGSSGCMKTADSGGSPEGCAWAARDMGYNSFTYVKHDGSCYVKERRFDDFCTFDDSGVISGEAAYCDDGSLPPCK